VLADMQGADPYTDAQLRNIVQQINARGELLEAMHIRFGFVVAPDKHTVYPQFLPKGVYGKFAQRRLSALDRAMAETGHAYYTDISDALREASVTSPWWLYYKSDTHWNHWGAYLGYQAWAQASESWLDLHRFDYGFGQFWFPPGSIHGDLGTMSGYQPFDRDIKPAMAYPCTLSNWNAPKAIRRTLRFPSNHFRTATCSGSGTALVIRDSFMEGMAPYLAGNFQRMWSIWAYPDDAKFGALAVIVVVPSATPFTATVALVAPGEKFAVDCCKPAILLFPEFRVTVRALGRGAANVNVRLLEKPTLTGRGDGDTVIVFANPFNAAVPDHVTFALINRPARPFDSRDTR